MRTYGRIYPNGIPKWVLVETDANGFNDAVNVTTLLQVLQLNLGESPFYSQYGIPAHPAVVQQVFPDFYVALTQQQFAQFFASLTISKQPAFNPTYRVNITTQQGYKIDATIAK